MIITRRFLENFLDLTGIQDEEITVALNSLGFEVDAYKSYQELNDNLTLGYVTNVAPMPGTHLNFCFVDKAEDLVSPIVTGATNVREGQYVVVADPGKTISTGVTLEAKELQGKLSEGMMVSLPEIGMELNALTEAEIKDHIYEVHTKQEPYELIGNQDALEIIGFKDSTWEVDLTLNRSDALGAMQLVKEIANYFDKKVTNLALNYEGKPSKSGVPISFVKTNESEKLIRSLAIQQYDTKKILSVEERTLNIFSVQDIWLKFNQVKTTNNFFLDLANAIAIETGQPVIFVDPKHLSQQLALKNNPTKEKPVNYQIMHGNEVVSTLGVDYNEKFLPTIESEQILAIYLSLDPVEMRKQQKAHNLSSVFLQRWMKPISAGLYSLAAKHVMYWFDQYELYQSSTALEIQIQNKEKPSEIAVELDFIADLLGVKLSFAQIKGLFKTLDFEVTKLNSKTLLFAIDPARTDVTHKAHVVEEIARLYGYNKIKAVAPQIVATPKPKPLNLNLRNQTENYLIGLGFNNVKTYSLMNKQEVLDWDMFNVKNPITLMSPLSQYREAYRLSLGRSLVEVANLNASRGNKGVKIYEFADVYNLDNVREKHLALLINGSVLSQKAYQIDIKPNFAYLKGILDQILNHYQINTQDIVFKNIEKQLEAIHPYINTEIRIKDQLLGFIYKLNPRFEQANKLDATFVLEINLEVLETLCQQQVVVDEVPRFQRTSRDVTMLLPISKQYHEVLKTIIKGVNYITNINLVDIYQDEALASQNQQAVSVGFEFNTAEKQLTDELVSAEWNKVLQNISSLKIEVK